MKRIHDNLRSSKGMIIWIVVMGSAFALKAIVEHKLANLSAVLVIMVCMITALEILERYFSYIVIYPDQSFRVVAWFIRKPRVHPKEIEEIGFVPRALDKIYKELYVIYKNEKNKNQQFIFSIGAYSPYTLAKLLNQVITINSQIKLDDYCKDLVNRYNHTPESLERDWQEKFKFKWPLPQWLTDILMVILLLLCLYLFLHISTLGGWCWGRDNCYPGPII